MSDPASGWGTGQTAGGTAEYADGTLSLATSQSGAFLWSRRQVEGSWAAMRLSGTLLPSPEATGYIGLLCGGANDELVGAVLSTEGGWIFARISGGQVEILDSDLEAGLEVGLAEPIAFTLDCSAPDGGMLGLDLYVNAETVVSHETNLSPAAFDRVAAYAEANEGSFVGRFDDVQLIASTVADGLPEQMSQAAQMLLQHIPEEYRTGCFETPVSGAEPGALAALACALPEVSEVDLAEYVQFDTAETMDAAYQQRVDTYGVGTAETCQEGPTEGSYTIGGMPAGRLLCAEQTVGARYDWTDDRLNIITNLTDFDADYSALYEAWLEAGPNP